jgi:hypothetical protein
VLDPRGRTLTRAPRRNVLTLVLLLLAAPAPADYKDSFKKGIDAYDRKRWDEVVKHMREAIGENPAEGERIKLYGLRFEMYFPHFYLGAAYLNLGKCPEAVGEFKLSESQGAIRSSPRYAQLVDGLKSCEAMTPTTTTTTMPPAPIRPPTPVPTTLAPPPPPTTMASTAPPTTPIPNPPPTPTPTPASIAPPPAPPAVLREGAQAYFDRRYQEAVTLLSRATGLRARAAAQSLLLRSAARFALFRAGGEKDPDLRRLAAEDAAASRRADPTLRPDPEAFSPQFVDFFGASR